jgi:hypothetical protein
MIYKLAVLIEKIIAPIYWMIATYVAEKQSDIENEKY